MVLETADAAANEVLNSVGSTLPNTLPEDLPFGDAGASHMVEEAQAQTQSVMQPERPGPERRAASSSSGAASGAFPALGSLSLFSVFTGTGTAHDGVIKIGDGPAVLKIHQGISESSTGVCSRFSIFGSFQV